MDAKIVGKCLTLIIMLIIYNNETQVLRLHHWIKHERLVNPSAFTKQVGEFLPLYIELQSTSIILYF